MAPWTIELIETGPLGGAEPSGDPLLTGLGAALALRGHRVRLLDASGRPGPPIAGLTVVRVPLPAPKRGGRIEPASLGRNVADFLEPHADLVVGRDAILGALDLPAPTGGRPALVLLLDDAAARGFDPRPARAGELGLRGRVGGWLDGRARRRLQDRALERARIVLATSERLRGSLSKVHGLPSGRIALLPNAVAAPVDVGSRSQARQALKLPMDVEAVAFLGENAESDGLRDAIAAFRRVRPLFPGARLLVVGSPARPEPGVMALGEGDAATRARVLRASDVALFPARDGASGDATRQAMRSGVASVVSRHVPLDGIDPDRMVRLVPGDDPGDYASALAELFAVPQRRKEIARAGATYAEGLTFEKMAEAFEGRLAGVL
ncbi:MAG TPA: glycosyltransferase family 4 protein, partial [Thermoplasmata archaeon]|nr:glycosyltransferase family 4 protein [Thermoplasmata archaeon]